MNARYKSGKRHGKTRSERKTERANQRLYAASGKEGKTEAAGAGTR